MNDEAGFTLTECLAGLLVASLLLAGIAEMTRRYATTSTRIRIAAGDISDDRTMTAIVSRLDRAEPGSISVRPDRIEARIGDKKLALTSIPTRTGNSTIRFQLPDLNQSMEVSGQISFEHRDGGPIEILKDGEDAPLILIWPLRDAPYNCQFDAVTRSCR